MTNDEGVVEQRVSERTIEQLSVELWLIAPPEFPVVERVRVDIDREVLVASISRGAGECRSRGARAMDAGS